MKKGPLGRGLESLISSNSLDKKSPYEIDITDIFPSGDQPRKLFDQEKLMELSESIRQKGVVQPIIVTRDVDKYIIVAGERRWRAAGLAGLKKIPAIVKDISDEKERLELAIIENIQREDLSPVELANAYKNLIDKFSYTQEELGKIVGKSRSAVANILRLLKLPEKIYQALLQSRITEGHARALLGLEEYKEDILRAFEIVLSKKLSVRGTEHLVNRMKKERAKLPKTDVKSHPDNYFKDIRREFEDYFKAKVEFKPKKKGGTIEIKYSSDEELDAIIKLIRGE